MTNREASKEGKLRLLLVEDDIYVLDATKKLLEIYGFLVASVETASAAIEVFKSASFDLALIDINIPGGGGISTYREIRNLKNDLPVILLSGDGDPEQLNQFASDTFLSFVSKPYEPESFVKKLKQACGI